MSNNTTSTISSFPPTSTEDSPSSSTSPTNSNPTTAPTTSERPTSPPFTTTSLPPTTPPTSEPPPPPTTTPTTTQQTSAQTSAPSPPSTIVVTLTPTSDGTLQPVTTIVQTLTSTPSPPPSQTTPTTTTSSAAPTAGGGSDTSSSGGLSGAARTAVVVIVPIVAVALLLLAGLWFWRKRKHRKDAEEIRRKEVEEYGYNPNDDPTLPAVGLVGTKTGSPSNDGPFEMREDEAGYRGWGATAVASTGRKASTTVSGGPVGMAYSDGASPTHGPISDSRSGDTLINSPTGRPLSGGEEVLGAMGPPVAANRSGDMHRGPSNASSSYSAANRSDGSGDVPLPGAAFGGAQYYGDNTAYGGPYADGSFGPAGRAEVSGQPVIRDNLARRATRIENPSHFPTQASAGISQNF